VGDNTNSGVGSQVPVCYSVDFACCALHIQTYLTECVLISNWPWTIWNA